METEADLDNIWIPAQEMNYPACRFTGTRLGKPGSLDSLMCADLIRDVVPEPDTF